MASQRGILSIKRVDAESYIGNAQIIDDQLVFRIKDCRLKILNTLPENPSANILADSSLRAEYIIADKLTALSKELNFTPSIVRCLYDQRLKGAKKDLRHRIERPLIKSAVEGLFQTRSQ